MSHGSAPDHLEMLKSEHLIAFLDQLVEINLFSPFVISILHSMEVKTLASGK